MSADMRSRVNRALSWSYQSAHNIELRLVVRIGKLEGPLVMQASERFQQWRRDMSEGPQFDTMDKRCHIGSTVGDHSPRLKVVPVRPVVHSDGACRRRRIQLPRREEPSPCDDLTGHSLCREPADGILTRCCPVHTSALDATRRLVAGIRGHERLARPACVKRSTWLWQGIVGF